MCLIKQPSTYCIIIVLSWYAGDQDLKQNSFNSVAKNSSTPNKPKASVIPVQNEPINEKRKAHGSTGSKKKRKTKHTLFTDKPGTSNLTLN